MEEIKISPAVAIIPIGLGLGLVAIVGLCILTREEVEAHPENIILTDLSVSPRAVYLGETVAIDVIATNIGTERATKQIICEVDGVVVKSTVTLDPEQSTGVSFTATPTEVRTYCVVVDGLTDTFVGVRPPPTVGFITLYGTGFLATTLRWYAEWYYPEIGRYAVNPLDYYNVRYKSDPCTPSDPIPLDNLLIMVRQGSYEGGWTRHGPFGPFTVMEGGVYTLNLETGELIEGGLI